MNKKIVNILNVLRGFLNYGKDYQYAHSFADNFTLLEYLPDKISGAKLYDPGNNSREQELRDFLKKRWKDKYDY